MMRQSFDGSCLQVMQTITGFGKCIAVPPAVKLDGLFVGQLHRQVGADPSEFMRAPVALSKVMRWAWSWDG